MDILADEGSETADMRTDAVLVSTISPMALHLTPANATSSCGLDVDDECRAAIHMYTTCFAASVDTKHTAYSVPAVVLQTVASEPAAMHMVLALGRQHLANQQQALGSDLTYQDMLGRRAQHATKARYNYRTGLALLGDILTRCNSTRDLDVVLATLWLTAIYEQRFSRSPINAVKAHFQDVVASSTVASITHAIRRQQDEHTRPDRQDLDLSFLGARLLVWLLGLDARATTFGHDGVLNLTISKHLNKRQDWSDTISMMYQRSAPLFQSTWGADYPLSEIMYDIEHKDIFNLFRDCTHLRILGTEIRRAGDAHAREESKKIAHRRLEALKWKHAELFSFAARMPSSSEALGHELAVTMCWVMPHYFASVLDIMNASGQNDTDDPKRTEAVQTVLKLALHAYHNQGAPAMVRVAWPILMAGIEAPDPFQQQWAVDRLKELASFGECYQMAASHLEKIQRELRIGDAQAAASIEQLWSGPFFI